MTTWAIIYNPTSGGFRPERLEALRGALRERGVETEPHASTYAGHAIELGREVAGVERVISYGGDGTLNEVANGLMGRDLPLMFVPGGTANSMAHELKIPCDPVGAALALLDAEPVAIHPGRVGERLFMLMVGFGFDATAVYLVSKGLKSRLGALSYICTGVRALFHPKPCLRVETPSAPAQEGVWVVGARARRYGGMFSIHPRAGLTNPNLGTVVVSKAMIAPFALTNLAFGTGLSGAGMRLGEHTRFRVSSREPFHAHVDGDYLGAGTQFEVRVSEQPLRFCMPRGR